MKGKRGNIKRHTQYADILAEGAALFAAGWKTTDIATKLGYSKRNFEMLRQNNVELWEAGIQAALQKAVVQVRKLAAEHPVLNDARNFPDGGKRASVWAWRSGPALQVPSLNDLVEDYILSHDLSGNSPAYYRRCVSVFCSWYGGHVPQEAFTAELCNRFLLAKKEAGKASYYQKSLRSALRALLNHAGITGKLRPVRRQPLTLLVWTPDEVDRLIKAAPSRAWRVRIAAAYYTGLNIVDLEKVERRHIVDGVLRWRRQKTKKLVVVAVPGWLLDLLPEEGPICPWKYTGEMLRREFRAIVVKAGLKGSFKTLRKTSGTIVESLHPGCGHLHLGNSRPVFELHYMDPERALVPLSLSSLSPAGISEPIQIEPKAPRIPKVRIASNRGNLQLRFFCPEERREIRIRINTSDRTEAEAMRRDLAARLAQKYGGAA
jgi:integrase